MFREGIIEALSVSVSAADFYVIHCSGIDLSDRNLALVSLVGSDFRGAKLNGNETDLNGAIFEGAKCISSIFT